MLPSLEKKLKNLPATPGVYIFKNSENVVIYVGKAINLKNRVKSYFQKSLALGEKTQILVQNIQDIDLIKVDSEIEALLLEANLIQKYQPKYNIELKDNSTYPYLKISVKKKYPEISITRKTINDGSKYFGPYTDIKTLRYILRSLRVIFSPNLYFFSWSENDNGQKKIVKRIELFLKGKKDLLLKNLIKEMDYYARNENFEKANEIKNQIEKIKNITKPSFKPYEYLQNPNLIEDQIAQALQSLSMILNLESLDRIECYDVANIQGQYSASSMIVFTNGHKDTNSYRKFKIHINGKPNDYKMLEETFKRRLNHNEWPIPNLIVIDGGQGQLNIFNKLNTNIPAIALAKREDQIYYKNQKITLEKTSSALKLLQRIRDEAHRFATTYHKNLRQKALTNKL